jgi:hypothetical protein
VQASAAAATVQRAPAAASPGAAGPLVHAARTGGGAPAGAQTSAAVRTADGTVQRAADAGSTSTPAARPAATLPTRTAQAEIAPGPDPARIADQVYEMLVRRLADERRQRGG